MTDVVATVSVFHIASAIAIFGFMAVSVVSLIRSKKG